MIGNASTLMRELALRAAAPGPSPDGLGWEAQLGAQG
jgi:hypothetical protein